MKHVITDATKRQLGTLTEHLARITAESTAHRNAINQTLANRFGNDYLHDPAAIEYCDKHSNTVNSIWNATQLLQMALPQLDTADSNMVTQALDMIGRWDTSIADKPQGTAETTPQAMSRTLRQLNVFVGEHRGDFPAEQQWRDLHTHLDGLQANVRELYDHAATARRLSATINPHGVVLATGA